MWQASPGSSLCHSKAMYRCWHSSQRTLPFADVRRHTPLPLQIAEKANCPSAKADSTPKRASPVRRPPKEAAQAPRLQPAPPPSPMAVAMYSVDPERSADETVENCLDLRNTSRTTHGRTAQTCCESPENRTCYPQLGGLELRASVRMGMMNGAQSSGPGKPPRFHRGEKISDSLKLLLFVSAKPSAPVETVKLSESVTPQCATHPSFVKEFEVTRRRNQMWVLGNSYPEFFHRPKTCQEIDLIALVRPSQAALTALILLELLLALVAVRRIESAHNVRVGHDAQPAPQRSRRGTHLRDPC